MTDGPFSSRFLDELQSRLTELLRDTPAADLQRNLRAVLVQQLARLELVTREEFDTQAKVLARTRSKLDEMEKRLAAIETAAQSRATGDRVPR